MKNKLISLFLFFVLVFELPFAHAEKPAPVKQQGEVADIKFVFGPEFELRNFKMAVCNASVGLPLYVSGIAALVGGFIYDVAASPEYNKEQAVLMVTALILTGVVCSVIDHEKWVASNLADYLQGVLGDRFQYEPRDGHLFLDKKSSFWFRISKDPTVIEIQMKPLSPEELKVMGPQLQEDIFNNLKKKGITPAQFFNMPNGGHVNMDIAAFKDDINLFSKFMIDYMNHSELSTGVFLNDSYNAPAVANKPELKNNFKIFFSKKIHENNTEKLTMSSYMELLLNNTFTEELKKKHSNIRKYIEINIHYFRESEGNRRIEFRAVRAQQSIKEFEMYATLFSKRVEWLKTQPDLEFEAQLFPNPIDKIERFKAYVQESGLDWNEYYKLLPRNLNFYLDSQTHLVKPRYQNHLCLSGLVHPLVKAAYWFLPQSQNRIH